MSKRFTKKNRHSSIGDFFNEEKPDLFPYLIPCENFTPILENKIQVGDWLEGHKDMGQPFSKYNKFNPVTKSKNTIYVLPMEEITEFDINKVINGISCWFGKKKIKVKELKKSAISGFEQLIKNIKTRKSRGYGKQYFTDDIFKMLRRIIPKDAYCLIALTNIDLYPRDSWNFVFGKASLKNRYGVFSFARYMDKDEEGWEKILLKRVVRVCVHEIGPLCIRKIKKCIKLSLKNRYLNLLEFYKKYEGFENEAKWLETRITFIENLKKKNLSKAEYQKLFDECD